VWVLDEQQHVQFEEGGEPVQLAFELVRRNFLDAIQRMERAMAGFGRRVVEWCLATDPRHGPEAAARVVAGLQIGG
jgi:hypothetical protein